MMYRVSVVLLVLPVFLLVVMLVLLAPFHLDGKRAVQALYKAHINAAALPPIPRVCHQTWVTKSLDETLRSIVAENQRLNHDMEFRLYDNEDIKRYIEKHFDADTLRAYSHINPKYGAAQADFFRYCVLYNEGGVYLDIKSSLSVRLFAEVISPSDVCILDVKRFLSPWRYHLGYGTHEQWLLIFAPRHLYLKYAVEHIVDTLLGRVMPTPYGMQSLNPFPNKEHTSRKEQVLRLTGPDALGVAIHKAVVMHGLMHREVDYGDVAKINPRNYKSAKSHYSQLDDPFYI